MRFEWIGELLTRLRFGVYGSSSSSPSRKEMQAQQARSVLTSIAKAREQLEAHEQARRHLTPDEERQTLEPTYHLLRHALKKVQPLKGLREPALEVRQFIEAGNVPALLEATRDLEDKVKRLGAGQTA